MTTSSQRQVIWTDLSKERISDRRRRRGLITAAGVVALFIAVIALAGSGWPTDDKPEPTAQNLHAPEIPHSREGAQSAAAQIASAMGSERMFATDTRHDLLQVIVDPDQRSKLIQQYDDTYGPFTKRLGLDAAGRPPAGAEFVSRVMPAGTTMQTYTGSTASVDVWCATLFGLTGKGVVEEITVETGWLTITVSLRWTDEGWKLTASQQTDGPEPTDSNVKFGRAPQL